LKDVDPIAHAKTSFLQNPTGNYICQPGGCQIRQKTLIFHRIAEKKLFSTTAFCIIISKNSDIVWFLRFAKTFSLKICLHKGVKKGVLL